MRQRPLDSPLPSFILHLEMKPTVVALIGHSGAGKSACLVHLKSHLSADMDVAIGTTHSPTLTEAINWMTDTDRPSVIVLSNHEELLKALRNAKTTNERWKQLDSIHFIYLCKPKGRLKRHLSKPTGSGSFRPLDDQEYTLKHYHRFHRMFSDIADQMIDCSTASVSEVARSISDVVEKLLAG